MRVGDYVRLKKLEDQGDLLLSDYAGNMINREVGFYVGEWDVIDHLHRRGLVKITALRGDTIELEGLFTRYFDSSAFEVAIPRVRSVEISSHLTTDTRPHAVPGQWMNS